MPALVAFDLDGTLIDSRQDLAESANALLATYGAPPLEVDAVAAMVGDGARQLVERALVAAQVSADVSEALTRFLDIYGARLTVHTRPYAGMHEALTRIGQTAVLAVVTNKPEGLSRALLEAFGMAGYFAELVGGDSGFPRKPDPAGLRHVIARAGAKPGESVYVGDSMIDVETARAAGAAVVVAAYGFGHLRQPLLLGRGERRVGAPTDLPVAVAQALGRRA